MRAQIFAHQLYLFGGVAFGFAVGATTRAPLSGVFLLAILLVSLIAIITGFLMLRKARTQLTQQINNAAAERMMIKPAADQSKELSDAP
jgi:hypothetical protein